MQLVPEERLTDLNMMDELGLPETWTPGRDEDGCDNTDDTYAPESIEDTLEYPIL